LFHLRVRLGTVSLIEVIIERRYMEILK
jgi:hypothetical protein